MVTNIESERVHFPGGGGCFLQSSWGPRSRTENSPHAPPCRTHPSIKYYQTELTVTGSFFLFILLFSGFWATLSCAQG